MFDCLACVILGMASALLAEASSVRGKHAMSDAFLYPSLVKFQFLHEVGYASILLWPAIRTFRA